LFSVSVGLALCQPTLAAKTKARRGWGTRAFARFVKKAQKQQGPAAMPGLAVGYADLLDVLARGADSLIAQMRMGMRT
jgi:hypothetical protein